MIVKRGKVNFPELCQAELLVFGRAGLNRPLKKAFRTVILSEAKNLALSIFNAMRDPCEILRCHENDCAEGTLECGSSSYRLFDPLESKAAAEAAALQGASRIFMHRGEPKDHEVCAQNDSVEGFFRSLYRAAKGAWRHELLSPPEPVVANRRLCRGGGGKFLDRVRVRNRRVESHVDDFPPSVALDSKGDARPGRIGSQAFVQILRRQRLVIDRNQQVIATEPGAVGGATRPDGEDSDAAVVRLGRLCRYSARSLREH